MKQIFLEGEGLNLNYFCSKGLKNIESHAQHQWSIVGYVSTANEMIKK